MFRIVAPIKHNSKGFAAKNLIEAIQFLGKHNVIKTYDPPNAPAIDEINSLLNSAAVEYDQSVFGEFAARILFYLQIQNGLGDQLRGGVDENTANLINSLLEAYGVAFGVPSAIRKIEHICYIYGVKSGKFKIKFQLEDESSSREIIMSPSKFSSLKMMLDTQKDNYFDVSRNSIFTDIELWNS